MHKFNPGDKVIYFKSVGRAKFKRILCVYLGPSSGTSRVRISYIDEKTGNIKTQFAEPENLEKPRESQTEKP